VAKVVILEPTIASEAVVQILQQHYDVILGYKTLVAALKDKIINPDEIVGFFARLSFNLDKEFLSQFGNLKFVATVTTGVTHIDTSYLDQNKIRLFTLRDCPQLLSSLTGTSELGLTLFLALHHNLVNAVSATKKGEWDRSSFFRNQLSGQRAGIIGLGRLGTNIAKSLSSLGMEVIYTDIEKKPHAVYEKVSLSNLLESASVIFITASFCPPQKPILNLANLKQLLLCPLIINIA